MVLFEIPADLCKTCTLYSFGEGTYLMGGLHFGENV